MEKFYSESFSRRVSIPGLLYLFLIFQEIFILFSRANLYMLCYVLSFQFWRTYSKTCHRHFFFIFVFCRQIILLFFLYSSPGEKKRKMVTMFRVAIGVVINGKHFCGSMSIHILNACSLLTILRHEYMYILNFTVKNRLSSIF